MGLPVSGSWFRGQVAACIKGLASITGGRNCDDENWKLRGCCQMHGTEAALMASCRRGQLDGRLRPDRRHPGLEQGQPDGRLRCRGSTFARFVVTLCPSQRSLLSSLPSSTIGNCEHGEMLSVSLSCQAVGFLAPRACCSGCC